MFGVYFNLSWFEYLHKKPKNPSLLEKKKRKEKELAS